MTFIDLEPISGTIVANQIVRMRSTTVGNYHTVITLVNNQDIFTEKTIDELKVLING
jgi:hypothetical protein